MSAALVIALSFAYLLLLFAVAWLGDQRARQGRSLISSPLVYALSLGVFCTAWTYFGSVGRATASGYWFLPTYLGPTLALALGSALLLKMIRIAKTYRLTTIADFIAARYGKSYLLGGLVSVIVVVGIIPYIALQLKAIAVGYEVLTIRTTLEHAAWYQDKTLYVALVLALFTVLFGARHLDSSDRHEGMVAAIAFESVVKLVAFLIVGAYITWGLLDGFGSVFERIAAHPEYQSLLHIAHGVNSYAGWFAMTALALASFLFLPRQFQVLVVENVHEEHLRRAIWLFPLYLLLINLFVVPIAFGGLLLYGRDTVDPDMFLLYLPLMHDQPWLAMLAFIGGLSAATGMVIVETVAVSTMVSNNLVIPWWLARHGGADAGHDMTRLLLRIRRVTIVVVLLLGYLYFRLAGEAYALVAIGLISFAAVAQFAPAIIGGLYWRGGTRDGALAGLAGGFVVWLYTLLLPSFAKSGWLDRSFLDDGLWGVEWLRPEALFGLGGLDHLSHALLWSLLVNMVLYVGVSLLREPDRDEITQASLFVDVFKPASGRAAVLWRGSAHAEDLERLLTRFVGAPRAAQVLAQHARENAGRDEAEREAELVHVVETQLAGAIGSASARVMVASVVKEEPLGLPEILNILDEASQVRAYSHALEQATAELQDANARLQELERLKDDIMSSVTHELRTPLTSIRALSEMMHDDPEMDEADRQRFLGIIVGEAHRLSRLINQVLDLAKIEAGRAEWSNSAIDMAELARHVVDAAGQLFRDRDAELVLEAPASLPPTLADHDRLHQVLLNLLSNAAKFVPPGSGRASLRVWHAATSDTLEVEVADNGPGIDAELLPHLFEKFQQGGDARNRPQGTGLGLAISREIVEHFGGRLWVESTPGEGARFRLSLPRAVPEDGDDTASG